MSADTIVTPTEAKVPRYKPRQLKTPAMSAALTYTIDAAAAITGVGRDAIYDALRDGSLVGVKWGTRTLVTAESLRRKIETLPRAYGAGEAA
jgi:excisionase family DNA binding protein